MRFILLQNINKNLMLLHENNNTFCFKAQPFPVWAID